MSLIDRIEQEEDSKTKQCCCTGCSNQATHTEEGHPVCKGCAMPKYKSPASFPIILGV